MKSAVIVFPGSNRERDAGRAIRAASGVESAYVWHTEAALPAGTDLVVLPGGFSYGDYLRCGAIASRSPVMDAVRAHAARGGYILAVCNGFQIACESGLLPGVLMRNAGLKFVCKFHHLRVERNDTDFTRAYDKHQAIRVCSAHGEGNYIADTNTLRALEDSNRIAFRYCDENGAVTKETNFNGSLNAIAGIYSANLRVLGMMPHPENLIDDLAGGTDGLGLFQAIVKAAA